LSIEAADPVIGGLIDDQLDDSVDAHSGLSSLP